MDLKRLKVVVLVSVVQNVRFSEFMASYLRADSLIHKASASLSTGTHKYWVGTLNILLVGILVSTRFCNCKPSYMTRIWTSILMALRFLMHTWLFAGCTMMVGGYSNKILGAFSSLSATDSKNNRTQKCEFWVNVYCRKISVPISSLWCQLNWIWYYCLKMNHCSIVYYNAMRNLMNLHPEFGPSKNVSWISLLFSDYYDVTVLFSILTDLWSEFSPEYIPPPPWPSWYSGLQGFKIMCSSET